MVVEINENDCSVIRWSPNGKTDWKSANIDDLIHAYEPKCGRWITRGDCIYCSECRKSRWSRIPYESLVKRFNFCPNCGARME